MPMTERLRIIVSGMVAGDPHQGGATWAVLQYVLGLRDLGHDVHLIEPIAARSVRPAGVALTDSDNAVYFADVVERFDLEGRAALVRQDTRETVGASYSHLVGTARRADLLVNISGMLTDPEMLEPIPRRVYLDLDPAFNQLWHAVEGIDVHFAGHTHYVTVGSEIGGSRCTVPTCGLSWWPTLQPVVLTHWRATAGRPEAAWTTVGNWRGYGSITAGGVHYGQKAHSMRRFMDLPRQSSIRFRLAMSIHAGEVRDLESLARAGWDLVNPAAVAGTPAQYQTFIQQSKGELGIAKSGYVESQCGWFSDRSVCYLASARPVVAQDTGFSSRLPVGEGLLAFRTIEEAIAALETVERSYEAQCRRAREIAESYFDSKRVLTKLLDHVNCATELVEPTRSAVGDHAVASNHTSWNVN